MWMSTEGVKMGKYDIKFWQELGWSILVTVAVFVFTALADLDSVTDWRNWATALIAGCVRVAAAAALNAFRAVAIPTNRQI